MIGQTVELAGLHRDGREFPIELSLATWEADNERFYSGIIRDITERKLAEDALQVANKSLNEKNDQLEALSGKLAKYLSRQVYDSIFEGKTTWRTPLTGSPARNRCWLTHSSSDSAWASRRSVLTFGFLVG